MSKEKTDESITLTKGDLKELLDDINKEYKAKLDAATTEVERLRATMEMQERTKAVQAPSRPAGLPKVSVIGSFNPLDQHGKLAKPYIDKNPDKYYRYIASRPDSASSRRAQGFEPVLDAKGNEVRYHDSILASMPKTQFEEEISKPIEALKEHKRRAIQSEFEIAGDQANVKTFGAVTYDKGEDK